METELEDQEENIQGVDQLLQVVDRYLNIQELTPEILHEFVERILVHERSEGRKKKGLGRFLFKFIGKLEEKCKRGTSKKPLFWILKRGFFYCKIISFPRI